MKAKDIILLHGWGGTYDSLKELGDFLSKNTGYNVHKVEMPGHGKTPEMDTPWGMKEFTSWLREIINKKELASYVLLGHSFGGKIILEGVSSKLLKPEAIVLLDANGIKPRNSIKKSFFRYAAKILKPISSLILKGKIRYWFYRIFVGEVDYVKTSKNVKESFKIFNEQHYDDVLAMIDLPTLIIWGKNDTVTPLWMGKKMNENIKNSKMIVLDGTHGLPRQKPAEVGQHIIEFLNG